MPGQAPDSYSETPQLRINDGAARLLAVHADLASRAAISPADRPAVAARLIQAAEAMAPYVTDSDVIPYEAVAGAAARLDADVALAAVSRWDDQDRIRLARTLPAALLGAVDGGSVPAAHALALDHLIEDDLWRLRHLLAVTDRLRKGAADTSAARLALNRAAVWIRRDVPARAQPGLACRLLDWAAERGLDGHVGAVMEPVAQLALDETDRTERWHGADPPTEAQALLAEPLRRQWTALAADAILLAEALVSGEQIRGFITAVASAAPAGHRVEVLTAIADLPDRVGVAVTLPVLARCLAQWRDWPGVTSWAATALPGLLSRHLPSLFWWQDIGPLVEQLRAFADDDSIRRAVLTALPEVRSRLTAHEWQNLASLLGRLCGPHDSATALTALLADRLPNPGAGDAAGAGVAGASPAGPLPPLLWSAFGHPRREILWRAAHATRELLLRADLPEATRLAAALVGYLDRPDAGPYRDSGFYFYRLSAAAALLAALARIAADKPAVLAAQLPALARHAASRELPHAQIRHPVSGRAVGAVNLTCWRKDAGRLLIALAQSTARQVTQGLLDDSSAAEFQLLREYLRACRYTGGLVFALTHDMVLMNDQARDTLDPGDQAALLGHAAGALAGDRPAAVDVVLPTGARARMHCRPLRGKGRRRLAGGVVHVKLTGPASQAASGCGDRLAGAQVRARPGGLRSAVAASLRSGGGGLRLGRVALAGGRARSRQAGAAAGSLPAPQPGRRVPRAGRRRSR